MPRVLDADRNVLEIEDSISGDVLEVHYQMPSSTQRVRYSNALTVRKGGKVKIKNDIFSIQADFGMELISGIRKGDFIIGGVAFASEPDDPAYDSKWKKHMRAGAPDVLAYLARKVFASLDKPSEGVEFEELDAEDLDNPEADFAFAEVAPDDAQAATPAAEEAVAAGDPLSGQ